MTIRAMTQTTWRLCIPAALALSCLSLSVHAQGNSPDMQQVQQIFEQLQQQTSQAQQIFQEQKERMQQQAQQVQQQTQQPTQQQAQQPKSVEVDPQVQQLMQMYQAYFGRPADTSMMIDLASVSQTAAVSMTATLVQMHKEFQQSQAFFQNAPLFLTPGAQPALNTQGLQGFDAKFREVLETALQQFASVFEKLQTDPFFAGIFAQLGLNPDFIPGSGTFGGGTVTTSLCPAGQFYSPGVGCI